MKFNSTEFEGLYVIDPDPFKDDRGQFFRVFCKNSFEEIGHTKEFVQINQSMNKFKGTFRGFHYQLQPSSEVKLVRCISGKLLDVVVDVRKNSKTFLQHFIVELSEENKKLFYIPEGFAHGFITLTDNAHLVYYVTANYNPDLEQSLNIKDPLLDIQLPIDIISISEKDKKTKFIDSSFKGI